MEKINVIGVNPQELPWVRLLIALLRNPDPVVHEIAREALLYVERVAARADETKAAG